PAILPPVLHVTAAHSGEERPQPLLAGRVGVGGELDAAFLVDLLEAFREQLEHGRARLLEATRCDFDRDSAERAQRNALFSFSKNDSSWRYVCSSLRASNSSSRRRCSSFSRRGTETFTSTRWSPRPKPCSTGMPLPRSTLTSPGCVPGDSSSSSGPSRVSTVLVEPSAASTIVRSTWGKTSL